MSVFADRKSRDASKETVVTEGLQGRIIGMEVRRREGCKHKGGILESHRAGLGRESRRKVEVRDYCNKFVER